MRCEEMRREERARPIRGRPGAVVGASGGRLLSHFVVGRGEDVYLKMLLVDNLMHADLHPGNILLQGGPEQQPSEGRQS